MSKINLGLGLRDAGVVSGGASSLADEASGRLRSVICVLRRSVGLLFAIRGRRTVCCWLREGHQTFHTQETEFRLGHARVL